MREMLIQICLDLLPVPKITHGTFQAMAEVLNQQREIERLRLEAMTDDQVLDEFLALRDKSKLDERV